MRKVLSLFLSLCLALAPCVSQACRHEGTMTSTIQGTLSGDGYIFHNSKFDYMAMIRPFSDNIVDCLPIVLFADENERHLVLTIEHPVVEQGYDCYLINADCQLIGNIKCDYLVCTCGDAWYDLSIVLAPNMYMPDQVVYLVWVE